MAFLQTMMVQFQLYWQIPGFRVGLGVALLAIGVIIVMLPEGRMTLGVVLAVVGLGALMSGISEIAGLQGRRPPPPPPQVIAPRRPPSFMHIEVGTPPSRP